MTPKHRDEGDVRQRPLRNVVAPVPPQYHKTRTPILKDITIIPKRHQRQHQLQRGPHNPPYQRSQRQHHEDRQQQDP